MVADEGLACQGFSRYRYVFLHRQAVCDDGNAPFTGGVNAQTGACDKLELIIEKPILAIGEVSGMITYNPPGEEMVDITIELNTRARLFPSVPVYLNSIRMTTAISIWMQGTCSCTAKPI
ncbi:MAG: hypothetical protein R2787_04615 [Saprospiraceae bacterium]